MEKVDGAVVIGDDMFFDCVFLCASLRSLRFFANQNFLSVCENSEPTFFAGG